MEQYDSRHERTDQVKRRGDALYESKGLTDEEKQKKKRKKGVKHKAAKPEQKMIGDQLMAELSKYLEENLKRKLTEEELASLSLTQCQRIRLSADDEAQAQAVNEKAKIRESRKKQSSIYTKDRFERDANTTTGDADSNWMNVADQYRGTTQRAIYSGFLAGSGCSSLAREIPRYISRNHTCPPQRQDQNGFKGRNHRQDKAILE